MKTSVAPSGVCALFPPFPPYPPHNSFSTLLLRYFPSTSHSCRIRCRRSHGPQTALPDPLPGYPSCPWISQPTRPHGKADVLAAAAGTERGHRADGVAGHDAGGLGVGHVLCPPAVQVFFSWQDLQRPGRVSFYVIHRLFDSASLSPTSHHHLLPITVLVHRSSPLFLPTPSYQLTFLLPSNSLRPAHLSPCQFPPFQLPPTSSRQVSSYAQRKDCEVAAVERWLAPILSYDAE